MSSSVFVLQVSPSIPPSLQRLDDLAKNFWFSWNAELGQLFGTLDPALWRKVEGSPRLFLRSVDQSILEHAAADPSFTDAYRRIVAAFDDYLGAKLTSYDGLEQRGPDRLFLRRVRLARELPDLLGRPGRARRRSLQDCERSAPAVRGGRLAVSAGLFSPTHRPQRPAGPGLPADRSAQRSARVGTESRRDRGSRELPRARQGRRGASLESGRRARHGAAARYRRAGERSRRSADHGQALWRQQRAASATGSGARYRRRARAASARSSRRPCGTSTRGTPRS